MDVIGQQSIMLRSTSRALFRHIAFPRSPPCQLTRHVLSIRRHYANKPTPSQKPISDYIASQPPPSNPETPPDRMPHQTEEDIATQNIFGNSDTASKDGLPSEGVPVEEVFGDNPKAMEKAPKAIKEESQ
jgi:hypothetical protein